MKIRYTHDRLAVILLPLVLLTAAGAARIVPIPCLSGFVTDPNGAPVAEADLDFTDSVTGDRLVTPGDNTDASGFYNVCVLPGIYDVSYAPPAGTRLRGKLIPNVDLRADQGLERDVVLEFGTVVSGTIEDESGMPVGEVDVDVDQLGVGRIYTPDDNSDPITGAYWVVIPDGLHRLRFEPAPGSRLRGVEIDSVTVAGDRTIDVTLVEGSLLSGRVTEAGGGGLFDVDVDLRRADDGSKIFVANNATDENGDYLVAVPTGTFQLRFAPPRGSRHVAELIDGFAMGGDRAWNEELAPGLLVSVVVRDQAGQPVPGADIDVKIAATGEKIFTPHDRTDADGVSPSAVPANTYTIQIDPPAGTIFDRAVLDAVPVTADTTIVVVLDEVPRVSASGRVVDQRGLGLAEVTFDAHLLPGGAAVFLPDDATDATGAFDLALPMGTYDILVAPPQGAPLVGRKLDSVPALGDSAWGEIVLEDGWLVDVTVRDQQGFAVVGADLDFRDADTGLDIYTPHDNTDGDGLATVAVPAGTYRLVITPPVDSGLMALTVEDLAVAADTEVAYVLPAGGSGAPRPVTVPPNQPNPFNAGTTVNFVLSSPAEVTVAVFDVRGRLIAELERGPREAGSHTTDWDGRDRHGAVAPSGTYVLQVRTTVGTESRKMALVR